MIWRQGKATRFGVNGEPVADRIFRWKIQGRERGVKLNIPPNKALPIFGFCISFYNGLLMNAREKRLRNEWQFGNATAFPFLSFSYIFGYFFL